MNVEGTVTIRLKDFTAMQQEVERVESLEKRIKKIKRDVTDIIEEYDDTDMEQILKKIDESNMTDKQVAKAYQEAVGKLKITVSAQALKKLLRKYIETGKLEEDCNEDVRNAEDAALEQIEVKLIG